jgi:hypothetical protein
MAQSQVDPSKTIDADTWAVSLLVTATYALGHTLVAVEGLLGGTRKSVVAHYVPFTPPGTGPASKTQLLMGTSNGLSIQGQVKIKAAANRRTETVREKVGAPFSFKTWRVSRQRAFRALDRINIDSVRASAGVFVPRYHFRMLGQLTRVTPDTLAGINCANWSQMMLAEAGIMDQGGMLIDFPRTQALPGSRSAWMSGFLFGLGAVSSLVVAGSGALAQNE